MHQGVSQRQEDRHKQDGQIITVKIRPLQTLPSLKIWGLNRKADAVARWLGSNRQVSERASRSVTVSNCVGGLIIKAPLGARMDDILSVMQENMYKGWAIIRCRTKKNYSGRDTVIGNIR